MAQFRASSLGGPCQWQTHLNLEICLNVWYNFENLRGYMLWQAWLSGGVGGLLIEVVFTGLYSLLSGNLKLTCQTSLWMILVYGTARCLFDYIGMTLHYNRFIMGCIYTPLIYLQEFAWGFLFLKVLKKRLWDYGGSKITPMGLINFFYFPAWFVLALFFDKINYFLHSLEKLVFSS